jgi:hypothetical protein
MADQPNDAPVVLVRNVLGFHKDEGGSHASIGFQPVAGNPFGLAFSPEVLMALFSATVNALGQWPMPRMQNRQVCSIAPKWIEVGQDGPDDFALSMQLDHGGWIHFHQNKESLERLIDLLISTVRGAPNSPLPGTPH